VTPRKEAGSLSLTNTRTVFSPLLFCLATAASFIGHLREVGRGCRQGRPRKGSLDSRPGSLVVRLISRTTPHPRARSAALIVEILNSSALYLITSGSKRSLDLQEDTPELKRRRTAGKRSRPASSDTETLYSTAGSSAPSDEGSELVTLRKTLQQVQEDLSSIQQDQRQLDNITRGLQRDRDEAQPRETLRFLEEHFTCAMWVPLISVKTLITQNPTSTRP
jgi:hypothetical protein